MSKYCSNCGTHNPDTNNACGQCGNLLPNNPANTQLRVDATNNQSYIISNQTAKKPLDGKKIAIIAGGVVAVIAVIVAIVLIIVNATGTKKDKDDDDKKDKKDSSSISQTVEFPTENITQNNPVSPTPVNPVSPNPTNPVYPTTPSYSDRDTFCMNNFGMSFDELNAAFYEEYGMSYEEYVYYETGLSFEEFMEVYNSLGSNGYENYYENGYEDGYEYYYENYYEDGYEDGDEDYYDNDYYDYYY